MVRRVIASISGISESIWKKSMTLFENVVGTTVSQTYLACFCQHNVQEDGDGRLSMWRAFGGLGKTDAVALVIRPPFTKPATSAVFRTPVEYWDSQKFEAELVRIAEKVDANSEAIKTCSEEAVAYYLSGALIGALLGIKHPAFREEQEWRIYTALVGEPPSLEIEKCTEVVRGTPQTILKLKFGQLAQAGHDLYSLDSLIEQVIVGPSKHQDMVRQVFIEELNRGGVCDAASRVVNSGIPIRV